MSDLEPGEEERLAGLDGDPGYSIGGEKIGTFASLRVRNFRLLLLVTILSNAGQWIQSVTLSWLVYNLTSSGTMLGTLNVVRSSASLGLTPLAGVLIDRINRKILMTSTNGWLFIISLAFGLVLVSGRIELLDLFIFTFLGGISQAATSIIVAALPFKAG
jgi:Na+/melibiose symporter-like transporter|tara:strand:+ start:39 stop:518 length:480 start_codon:yes stop_codon:yes gene_type:complete